ncbi:MAG: TetR/AcrR family transcriptional regulator [Proteobacteria bacterium]|nr:TetR/AcrR family transcriptional regulator [Pseudomonadota bacterium]MBU1582228.1 TetR/AcrR family transcriptional regulator [Pseudomonadota bacterium]MBU2455386.1 TetR/AcrR family transcriptional regulator [Pseudomonadota bacterium]MBU2628438.1 TetR/AcrR family transcriptional regulator [Pseudomonadota bacterium]
MKSKSDETRGLLLAAAMKEFLEKGFRSASLRSIAKNSNGTTGIIYTYFKNKNEIFEILVSPVVFQFEKRLATEEISIKEALEGKEMSPKEWFTKNLRFLLRLLEKYPDEMKLLFLKSEGSSFETYKDFVIENGTRRSTAIFRTLNRSKAFKGQELSEFFILNLVKFVLNIVVEAMKQNKGSKDIVIYEEEITSFLFSGWKALVEF